jgi:beta-N-acetylhexosaminidase
MNIIRKILILAFTLIFYIGCSDDKGVNTVDEDLNLKIGQMLMVGFRGLEINDDSPISKQIKAGIVGGVVLFSRDVALGSQIRNIQSPWQVKRLNDELQSYAKIPLLIAVDQEGGFVARLSPLFGFNETVSQKFLGEADDIYTTTYFGELIADMLSKSGFNQNLAPVVDLDINPESPAIGAIERSFSDKPDVVVRHSKIIIEEHRKKNIITTLKHFPGHGSAGSDSHYGFTDVTDTWQEKELEPYRQLITNNYADVVMTAHVFNSKLDPHYPATLSSKVINGILRTELGFKGVVITDDMNMGAITNHYGLETAIELSINAGADILIFANNLIYEENIAIKAHSIIINLVKKGKISHARINQSYERIMNLKKGIANN